MLRLTILLLLVLAAPAAAKPGDLDRAFARHGRIAFAGGQGYSEASDAGIDGRGRILLAGTSQGGALGGAWAPGPVAARLTGSGRLDRRFGTAGRATLSIPSGDEYAYRSNVRTAVLPDGSAVVAATLRQLDHPQQITVQHLRADATPAFAATLVPGERWELAGLGVDRERRVVVAANRFGGQRFTGAVLRLLPGGGVDPAYERAVLPDGVFATALVLNPDGSAYVAGHRPGSGGRSREYVFAVDPRGHARRIASFPLLDRVGDESGTTALARGPRATLLVAGDDVAKSRVFGWIRRLRQSGALDRTFHNRRVAQSIADIALGRHGRIVLAGAREGEYLPRASVTRLTPSGRADRRFGDRGVRLLQLGARPRTHLIASDARAVAIDARGRIVVAGVAYDDNVESREDLGRSYFAAARLHG